MTDRTDRQLLDDYAANQSQEAFALLVERHINLVYSVAMRHVRNPHQAQDVTQAVFVLLAKKGPGLRRETILSGWLYQAARLTSITFLRGENRRIRREQESYMQASLDQSSAGASWEELATVLDEAMDRLGEKERDAIVLRYFEGKSPAEVAAVLNIREQAAKKRMTRGLEKLRGFFGRRGIAVSAMALGTVMTAKAVQAAPAGLAATISAVAVKGAAVSGSTVTLMEGALKLMAWAKLKTALVLGVGLLVAGGTTTLVVKQVVKLRARAQQEDLETVIWPRERREEAARIQTLSEQDETTHATTINLEPFINFQLTEAPSCWMGNNDNNLAELPIGRHIYAGVPFDVRGGIQLMGGWLEHYHKTYPMAVNGILIGEQCRRIYLLHAGSFAAVTNNGMVVGKLVLHYKEGSAREVNLVVGENVFDFWHPLFKTGVPDVWVKLPEGTERAWTGSNAWIRKWQPELSLVLYRTTLDNPEPDLTLASIDYVSTGTKTAPFMMGLTVE